ncbi:MAG: GNAT family N-acetyltransferase [Thiohalobacteraceae bacterium]
MLIRAYRASDLETVLDCFARAVRETGALYYSAAQIAAWAPETPDLDAWARRLGTGGVFVAEADGLLAGFVRADADGLIDLLYVHPHRLRRGVASALLTAGCDWARAQGARRFETQASRAARPFFIAKGFRVEREQSVERNGVSLRNYLMIKDAGGQPARDL